VKKLCAGIKKPPSSKGRIDRGTTLSSRHMLSHTAPHWSFFTPALYRAPPAASYASAFADFRAGLRAYSG